MERVALLISDLDGTLLGDDAALEVFSTWYQSRRRQLRLAYSSGRLFDSICESIRDFRLPMPDAIICGVGSEIHEMPSGSRIDGWPSLQGGWNPELINTICLARRRLTPQPTQLNSTYKISFFGRDLGDTFFNELLQELSAAAQRVTMVYSSRRDLDILPAGVHKGSAAAFLAQRWGIDRRQVVVAGDSGNDLAMFQEGFRGIVVGNAHPELRSITGDGVYQATDQYAAGLLEGLHHWHADLWQPRLQPID